MLIRTDLTNGRFYRTDTGVEVACVVCWPKKCRYTVHQALVGNFKPIEEFTMAETQRPAGVSEANMVTPEEQERDAKERLAASKQAAKGAGKGNPEIVEGATIERNLDEEETAMPNFRIAHDAVGIFAKGNVVSLQQLGGDIAALQRLIELEAIVATDEETTPSHKLKLLV